MEEDQLSLNFGSLFESGILSDVRLIVKNQPGKEFNVHKAILASRSPVLAAMFTGDFKEKNFDRLEIADVPADALEQMLRFIYTNQVDNLEKVALKLFHAADYVSTILYLTNFSI